MYDNVAGPAFHALWRGLLFAWQVQRILTRRAGFVAGAAFGEHGCTITWQGQSFMLCRGAC